MCIVCPHLYRRDIHNIGHNYDDKLTNIVQDLDHYKMNVMLLISSVDKTQSPSTIAPKSPFALAQMNRRRTTANDTHTKYSKINPSNKGNTDFVIIHTIWNKRNKKKLEKRRDRHEYEQWRKCVDTAHTNTMCNPSCSHFFGSLLLQCFSHESYS